MVMEIESKSHYTLTYKEYVCECTFLEDTVPGERRFTKLLFRKENLLLRYELFTDFIDSGYNSTKVGIKIGTTEEVMAHKVAGQIQIGCVEMTQPEFTKFYNLIKFKKNEHFNTRQIG